MLTRFGKFCRKLRIDRGELLVDMATKLQVSASFLSSVETGKKKPPIEWKNTLIVMYNLNEYDIEELSNSLFEARNQDNIDMAGYNKNEKDLMLAFARKINTFDEDRLKKIRKMIDG